MQKVWLEGLDAPRNARIGRYQSVREQRWARPDALAAARRYNQLDKICWEIRDLAN